MGFKTLEEAKEYIYTTTKKYSSNFKLPYKVGFSNRMSSALGRCREYRLCGNPIKLEFTYNLKYIKNNLSNGYHIEKTVLHEIAHAIVGAKHGHDKVWVECCERLGGNAKRFATGVIS